MTDFNIFACPASKTTRQALRQLLFIFRVLHQEHFHV